MVWTESSQFLCRAEGGCEFRELPLVMPPSKVCPQCNAVVPIRLKVCRNRLKFALYNADRVNFKSRNYHVVAYNISILAEGLHFSALVPDCVASFFFLSTERIDERYIKAPIAASKCRPTTSEVAWVFS